MLVSPNRQHERQFFYKYTSANTAKSILVNKALRLSSPLLFNDPFDVARRLKFEFTADDFEKAFWEELIRLLESPDEVYTSNPKLRAIFSNSRILTKSQRDIFVGQLRNEASTLRLEVLESFRRLEQKWLELLPLSRILSLSTVKNNPVMWWSYAGNYSGVVIELECLDIYDSLLLDAKEVTYTDEMPTMGSLAYWLRLIVGHGFDYEAYKETFGCMELTKTSHWAYEKEWRVLSFEKNSSQLYTDYQFHPRTFSKVFLGFNISDQDREDICRLADFNLTHLEIFDMELCHESRKIEFRKCKRPT